MRKITVTGMNREKKKYVILAAGGSGTRIGAGENKIFLKIGGRQILQRSILLFDGMIDGMLIVCRPEEQARVERSIALLSLSFPVCFVHGGDTRQHSVLNGLKALEADPDDIVLVHDAARCLTPGQVIMDVIGSVASCGSGLPGIPAVNTMKYSDENGMIII